MGGGGGQKEVAHFSSAKRPVVPRILCPAKISLKNAGEINKFSDEGQL